MARWRYHDEPRRWRTGLPAILLAGAGVVGAVRPADAITAAQRCQATKNATVGAYGMCRQKAEAALAKGGKAARYSVALRQCATRFAMKWAKTEAKAQGACPSTGDAAGVETFVVACSGALAQALGGGLLPLDVTTANTRYAQCEATVATTTPGLVTCQANLTTCDGSLTTCEGDVLACNQALTLAQACGNGVIDGGEACDGSELNGGTCAGQGFLGGTLRCASGCTFDVSSCYIKRFVDNGDGTVTDNQTGLQWEQKTDDGSVHDRDNTYTWNTTLGGTTPNGTAFTNFLGTLNKGTSGDGSTTSGCFAGHCDWRLPAIGELAGIVDCSQGSPCIDQTVFGPTVADFYWSASTDAASPPNAFLVYFGVGFVNSVHKNSDYYVRGVRSGL